MPDCELEIVQVLPLSGDWFAVIYDGGCWFMERVRSWVLVERTDDRCRWVTAIGEGCGPITDPIHSYQPGSEFFVAGDDLAPDGRTWRVVFNDPPPNSHRLKEVSDVMRAKEMVRRPAGPLPASIASPEIVAREAADG